ncbi:MAG: tetratricopeptide repeat protein [Deltaproteobacteria bacterium]|nr:tetratricopeptide repeat protein [Deltaproteobacteria bacterium]
MLARFEVLMRWWRVWGTLPVMAWVQGAALYRAGKFDEARRYYEKGLERHRRHPARFCAHMDLSYCLFRLRRFDEAEQHLQITVKHFPRMREASVRLARLQMWTGSYLEAAWTIKRILEHVAPDAELAALFLMAVIHNGGPAFLRKEALAALLSLDPKQLKDPRLEVGRALLAVQRGEIAKGRAVLEGLATQPGAPLEAHLAFSELLLSEYKIGQARVHLRAALLAAPDDPKVLTLLSESYLKPGPFYNPEYANQLAISACQNTGWLSPGEMKVLAQSFFHLGDKGSALIVASKAKQVGKQRLGVFKDSETLDELIKGLAAGTLA